MGEGTELGKVRGLGSAHAGEHHWMSQRMTAIANLLLGSWFVVSLALMPDYSHETITGWLSGTIPSLAMAFLIISVFWHARLGLQVLVDDYVHDAGNKFAVMVVLNFAAIAGVGAALMFLAKIVITAMAHEATNAVLAGVMAAGGAR